MLFRFELNRQLGLQLPEADGHHTLAGFVLERLQHIPAPGEGLRWKGYQYRVLAMDGPRIERVAIERIESERRQDDASEGEPSP
mgnify:FL=1